MITFALDQATRIRMAQYTGIVDDAQLLTSYAALLSDPDYDATLNDLVDLRGVARLEISADAMRQLISMYRPVDKLGVRTRLAVVAASDVTFGMSRMYELLRGDEVPEEIRVFRSYDDAVAWLGG
jgi:hypothetical protein